MKLLATCRKAVNKYNSISLIFRILIGIIIGSVIALLMPGMSWLETLGDLFVGALKAIAPVLVFTLVAAALARGSSRLDKRFANVIFLYMLTTVLASFVAVFASFIFPQTLVLTDAATADTIPQGIGEVMHTLLMNVVSNPFSGYRQ